MINLIKFFFNKVYFRIKFIQLNKNIFHDKKHSNNNNVFLVEFNAFHDSHVSLSVFSDYFREKYNYKIVAFFNYSLLSADLNFSLFYRIKWWLGNFFFLKNFGVYKSFNANEIIRPVINKFILRLFSY